MFLPNQKYLDDLDKNNTVFWSLGNNPTQQLRGLNIKYVLDHLKILYLLSGQIVASASYYFESNITEAITKKVKMLFENGDIIFFINNELENFTEHGCKKIEKSPRNFSAYQQKEIVLKKAKELDSIGNVLRRPSLSISDKIVDLWIEEVFSNHNGSIGAYLAHLYPNEKKLFEMRNALKQFAEYRYKDFVWEYIKPFLLKYNFEKNFLFFIRRKLAQLYSIATAELLELSLDEGNLSNRNMITSKSKYDSSMFMECMNVLGINRFILSLSIDELIKLKFSKEFIVFRQFYFNLIDATSYHKTSSKRIISFYENLEARFSEMKVTLDLFLKRFKTLCKTMELPYLKYRKPLDIIISNYELFNAKTIKDFIDLVNNLADSNRITEKEFLNRRREIMGKNIFIIHGHDKGSLLELRQILKEDFGLNPIILKDQSQKGAETIIEKFERYALNCHFAIAIFTPDDQVTDKNGNNFLQARPNVIYELGWFCGKIGRENVILILKDGTDIFSDFGGVIQRKFRNEVKEIYIDIKNDLKAASIIKN